MNLLETFEDVYKKANIARIPEYLYHKANPVLRETILREGLVPQIGDSWELFISDSSRGKNRLFKEELHPVVFLSEEDVHYDSTYDDDIYKIDTSLLDKSLFRQDLLDGCYLYPKIIPPEAFNLIYKGTGESK